MNNNNFSVYILVGLAVVAIVLFVMMNFISANQPALELPANGGSSSEISIFSKPEGKIMNESDLEKEFDSLEVMEDTELDIQ